MASDTIPSRPWGFERRGNRLVIGSIGDDGAVDEVVCFLDFDDSTHKPIETARAQFIIDAVNRN